MRRGVSFLSRLRGGDRHKAKKSAERCCRETGGTKQSGAKTDGAISGESRAVGALVQPSAKAALSICDEAVDFSVPQCGEIIDVQVALFAMTNAIVAFHFVPVEQMKDRGYDAYLPLVEKK